MRATNQITRMNNEAFLNKHKRPQRLLDEGGPLRFIPSQKLSENYFGHTKNILCNYNNVQVI